MKLFSRLFPSKKRLALVSVYDEKGKLVRATIDSIKNGKLSTLFAFTDEEEAKEKYNQLIAG